MSLTINGQATTKAKASSTSKSPIIIRQARLWEGRRIGEIAAKTYYDTPLINFLSPYREKYPADYVRAFTERSQARLLNPRFISFVACEASNPSYAIGYGSFLRLGDDEGAKKHLASRKSLWLWALSWLFWAYCKILELTIGDKSADPKATAEFRSLIASDDEKYWNSIPERKNRWHAGSVVVGTEFQGRGIGKRLMAEVLRRAEGEGVCVGLEASGPGEHMYRSVGFQLLGRFNDRSQVIDNGAVGGIMMWTPSSWETK
ncbi:hypothetical protein LHYA1_G004710 [Lachnellula hyalina]|uniref:N-acetyltransferase domain-containing protein n=1 Tax=Lachnellula hyalina TaxID=1316788 RepID=A0A8H8R1J2_9HELO|nr:uncharacterized protein LHYA1_G004710 [Lachnellula hyalina]TVY26748.1 hypothetical protein LHYA1_G004710 [Lachnellula hyalina]